MLAKKTTFPHIANRLLGIDSNVLQDLAVRMSNGEHVKPESEAEKACFQVLSDLDFVAAEVDGSTASRKYMKNEIWSLISYCGAPTWFVTFAPADVKHPIRSVHG